MVTFIQTNITEKEKTDFIVLCGLMHMDYKDSIASFIKVNLNNEFSKKILAQHEREMDGQQEMEF